MGFALRQPDRKSDADPCQTRTNLKVHLRVVLANAAGEDEHVPRAGVISGWNSTHMGLNDTRHELNEATAVRKAVISCRSLRDEPNGLYQRVARKMRGFMNLSVVMERLRISC